MLKELAVNAPAFFFQHVQSFFDNIFSAIRDPKVIDFNHFLLKIDKIEIYYKHPLKNCRATRSSTH